MPHVLIKYAHVLICISVGEGSRHFSAFHILSLNVPVSHTAPVQPLLQLQVSGDIHVPCTQGIVHIAITHYPYSMLKHQEYIPVSQIVPVQPALHVQLLGDAQVP